MRNDCAIGFVAGENVKTNFMLSLFDFIARDNGNKQRFGGAWQYATGPYVHLNRNKLAEDFLSRFRDRYWLMSVDTDMTFTAKDIYALLDEGDKRGPGIYAGPYAMPDSLCFGMVDEHLRYVAPKGVPDVPTPVDMAGTGFMLIHREVLEKVGPKAFNPLFTLDDGEMLAEDISFCIRASREGHTPILVPQSQPGHIKSVRLKA